MTDREGEGLVETGAELLRSAGEMLFGDRWKSALADILGVSPRTMKRWASGETDIDFDHGLFRDLRNQIKFEIDSLAHRRRDLTALEERLTDEIFGKYEFGFKP